MSGARFEFALDEELKKAACDDDVKAAIADKISRERIGHEVCSSCKLYLLLICAASYFISAIF